MCDAFTDIEMGLYKGDWHPATVKSMVFLPFDQSEWISKVTVDQLHTGSPVTIVVQFNSNSFAKKEAMRPILESRLAKSKILVKPLEWRTLDIVTTNTSSQTQRVAKFLNEYIEFENTEHQTFFNELAEGRVPHVLYVKN